MLPSLLLSAERTGNAVQHRRLIGTAVSVAFFASFLPRFAKQKPFFHPCTYCMAHAPIFPKSCLCYRTMMNHRLLNFGKYKLPARRNIRVFPFLGLLALCPWRGATVTSCCHQGRPRVMQRSRDTNLTYLRPTPPICTVLSDLESLPTYRDTKVPAVATQRRHCRGKHSESRNSAALSSARHAFSSVGTYPLCPPDARQRA